ncbi:MAG: MetQ/NlpA family ABC transporter substrate-binding protein [Xenophilus sp.]
MSEIDRKDLGTNLNRGFDVAKRSRLPLALGILVVVIAAAIAYVFAFNRHPAATAGEHFGPRLKVAYLSTDAAQEAFLKYIAKDIAGTYGIEVEPIGIGDPNQLHAAVSSGEIAATIYAHRPWIEQSNAANHWTLVPLEPVFQWAYSLWSSKYKSLDELPSGARIAILDDPANTAQALLFLANNDVIKLKENVDPSKGTVKDIAENPRNFKFVPIAFGTAARTLADFDGIISYNFEFIAAGTPAAYKIFAPEAPLVFASQLAVSKPYISESNVEKLTKAFADARVQNYLATTDDPAVKGNLAPVSKK